MLTTSDNPYNPYEDYNKWMQWDHDMGYYTQEYVARLVSWKGINVDDNIAMQTLYDEILKLNITGNMILAKEPA
jgi:hypothetical protein